MRRPTREGFDEALVDSVDGALAFAAAAAVSAQVPGGIGYEEASLLAGNCFNCHGAGGMGSGPIPPIAGMPAETMTALLNAFKQDLVPGATIMGRIALGYSDAEIEALARYFSGYWN